jgi:hypothetical protein
MLTKRMNAFDGKPWQVSLVSRLKVVTIRLPELTNEMA